MPTYAEASKTIEQMFTDHWAYTPVVFENVPAVDYSSASREELSQGIDPYIAIKLLYNDSMAAEIGQGAIKRTWGNIAVDIHIREDTGTAVAQANIDNLSDIFEYTTVQGIVFKNMTVFRSSTINGWHITPTMVRFYFNR